MIQETSTKAYREITVSGAKFTMRDKVFLTLYKSTKPMSNTEISVEMQLPINCITPRINELRKYGLVREAQKKQCEYTGRTVISWEVCR